MKTFTIRGIDIELDKKLKSTAQEESISVNQFIIKILRQVLGLGKKRTHCIENHDFDYLFGTWSKEDLQEFQSSQLAFNKIDSEVWNNENSH